MSGTTTPTNDGPKFELIEPFSENGEQHPLYELTQELIDKHHEHLDEAVIAIMWRRGWNADQDGRLTLGKMCKVQERDKRLHGKDFVMLLNRDAVDELKDADDRMLRALVDHELCHASVNLTEDGEVARDDYGRPEWRIRKHTIEEFHEIVARHGSWKDDVRSFVEVALESKRLPLLPKPGDRTLISQITAKSA